MRATDPARLDRPAATRLALLLWAQACSPPLTFTVCSSDHDCPPTHSCDTARGVCAARSVGDAAWVEASAVDTHLVDRGPLDQAGADQAAADRVAVDHGSTDATAADSATADVATSDAGRDGAGGEDQHAGDGAGPDALAGDVPAVDAAALDAGPGERGNQPPQVAVLEAPPLYPGASATWQGTAVDPDDAAQDLVIEWTLLAPPAGVFMDADQADPLRPQLWVTRALYSGGPAERSATVRLTATDPAGAAAFTEVALMVLDERGPYVDANSPWQGTGYAATDTARHGYCGAPGHACSQIQDAIVNLHDAQLNDGLWSAVHEVRVASTGTYRVVGPIHLGGNALSCGWREDFTARRGATARSRIEFTGDMGVQLQTSTAIDGCEIIGVEPLAAVGAARIAISGVDVGLVLKDSRAVGSATAGAVTGWALGLDLVSTGQAGFANIEGSWIEGGTATTCAIGLNMVGHSVRLAGSTLRGGQAEAVIGAALDLVTTVEAERSVIEGCSLEGGAAEQVAGSSAVGLAIAGGNPRIRAGCTVAGGSSGATVIGLHVAASATGVHLQDSDVVGLHAGSPSVSYGALLQSSLTSERCTYVGGEGTYSVGMYAEVGRAAGTTVTLVDDQIEAGTSPNSAMGLVVGSGVQVSALRGVIRGSADTSSTMYADALVVGAGADVEISDASVVSGSAVGRARGAVLAEALANLTTQDCVVVAGASSRSASEVFGIEHGGGALTLLGGSVTALGGDDSSRGVLAAAPALSTRVEGAQIAAGHALGAAGTSMGLEQSSGVLTVQRRLDGSEGSVAAGNATAESVGLHLQGSGVLSTNQQHLLEGIQITSARAASSTGLRLVQPGGTQVVDCTVQAGVAQLGRSTAVVIDTGKDVEISRSQLQAGPGSEASVGLWTEADCEACTIHRCTVRAGSASDVVDGISIGMRLARRAQVGQPTLVHGNLVVAGSAAIAHGVDVGGAGGSDLRVLHNTIDAGGRPAGISAGVVLGDVVPSGSPTRVAALVGNIIGAGQGATSYNIFENGSCVVGDVRWAEPVFLLGGRNNNLYPAGATALLHDFHARNIGGCADDVQSIDAVNGIDPYQQDGMVIADRTRCEDPALQGDGVHLGPGSPMVDRVFGMDTWWSPLNETPMADYDGEARPLGPRGDIGADELQ